MADEKAAEVKEAAPAGPKVILGFPLPVFALIALNVLTLLGGLGYITYVSLVYVKPAITEEMVQKDISTQVQKAEKKKEEVGTEIFTETIGDMTVLLKSAKGSKSHYATMQIVLGCPTENCVSQVKANKKKIEDAVQNSIAAWTYTELSSLETKFRVKHEVQARVNSFLQGTGVTEVYFTDFVVQ